MTLIRRLRVGETVREGDLVRNPNTPDGVLGVVDVAQVGSKFTPGPAADGYYGPFYRAVPQRFEIRGGDVYYRAREQFEHFITPELMKDYGQWLVDVADAFEQGGKL